MTSLLPGLFLIGICIVALYFIMPLVAAIIFDVRVTWTFNIRHGVIGVYYCKAKKKVMIFLMPFWAIVISKNN